MSFDKELDDLLEQHGVPTAEQHEILRLRRDIRRKLWDFYERECDTDSRTFAIIMAEYAEDLHSRTHIACGCSEPGESCPRCRPLL
jgi:hypothetical protein